jgi:hypothetical protein
MGIFTLLLLFFGFSFGVLFEGRAHEEKELEVKILEKVFGDLLKKKRIRVYVLGSGKEEFLNSLKKFSEKIRSVSSCESSDIVFIAGHYSGKIPKNCRGRMVFGSRREIIFRYPDSVGSFYWKKGRPNLTLIRERLKKRNIKLPPDYNRFIESLKETMKVRVRP